MTILYVSKSRGSDSNAGTSPSSPLATISKGWGSSGLSVSGDTVVVEPGIYRESLSGGASGVTIVADGDGSRFKAGGHATPVTGNTVLAIWSDDSTPTSAEAITISSKTGVSIQGFKVVGGSGTSVGIACFNLSGSTGISFSDCIFFGSATRAILGRIDATAGASLGVTFDRCDFVSVAINTTIYGVNIRSPLYSAEYSIDVVFRNCNFFGGAGGVWLSQNGGSGSFWATGVTLQNCEFWWCYRGIYVQSTVTLTTPIAAYACKFPFSAYGIVAGASGQVVENGNAYPVCANPLTLTSTGANSLLTPRPAISLHDERLWGGPIRPCFEPSAASPLLGAGNYGTPPADDLWNRARPDGGSTLPSIGSIERHDTGVQDTTYPPSGETSALKLTGRKTHDILYLVDPTSTAPEFQVAFDGNHGNTDKPQIQLLPNPLIGVAGETLTATVFAGSGSTPGFYEILAFTPFTPTAKGVVVVRFISRAASDSGAAYFS